MRRRRGNGGSLRSASSRGRRGQRWATLSQMRNSEWSDRERKDLSQTQVTPEKKVNTRQAGEGSLRTAQAARPTCPHSQSSPSDTSTDALYPRPESPSPSSLSQLWARLVPTPSSPSPLALSPFVTMPLTASLDGNGPTYPLPSPSPGDDDLNNPSHSTPSFAFVIYQITVLISTLGLSAGDILARAQLLAALASLSYTSTNLRQLSSSITTVPVAPVPPVNSPIPEPPLPSIPTPPSRAGTPSPPSPSLTIRVLTPVQPFTPPPRRSRRKRRRNRSRSDMFGLDISSDMFWLTCLIGRSGCLVCDLWSVIFALGFMIWDL